MLNTSQACVYLGVTRKTYQGWIKDGHIKAEMKNGKWMVDENELNRFLQVRSGILDTPSDLLSRKEAVKNQISELDHIRPEHEPLIKDYIEECVRLESAKTSKERSDSLARKLKLAEALLLTPRSLAKIQELSEQLELSRSLNDIFIIALTGDQFLGELYQRRATSIAQKIKELSNDFMSSGLPFPEWRKGVIEKLSHVA